MAAAGLTHLFSGTVSAIRKNTRIPAKAEIYAERGVPNHDKPNICRLPDRPAAAGAGTYTKTAGGDHGRQSAGCIQMGEGICFSRSRLFR